MGGGFFYAVASTQPLYPGFVLGKILDLQVDDSGYRTLRLALIRLDTRPGCAVASAVRAFAPLVDEGCEAERPHRLPDAPAPCPQTRLRRTGGAMRDDNEQMIIRETNRLRQKAKRRGLRLEKSRQQLHSNNHGGLQLIRNNIVIAGVNYELSPAEAEYWIDRSDTL